MNYNKQFKIKKISDILLIPNFLEIFYNINQKDQKNNFKKNINFLTKKITNNIKNGNLNFSKLKKNVSNQTISIFSIEFLIFKKAIQYLLKIIFKKWFQINWKNINIEINFYKFKKEINKILIKNNWFIKGKVYNLINYNHLLININNIIKDQIFIDLIYKILKIKTFKKDLNDILLNIFLYNFDYNILKLLNKNKNIINFNYIRFNNNFIVGIRTKKENCNNIKNNIFLLLNNKVKFLLNTTYKKIYFLGYIIYLNNTFNLKIKAPTQKIIIKLFINGFCKRKSTPTSCGKLIHKSLYEIIIKYLILQQKICYYYLITINYHFFSNRIHYILKYSCALTFASKLKLNTLKKVFKRFGKNLTIFLNKKNFIKIFFIKPNFKN